MGRSFYMCGPEVEKLCPPKRMCVVEHNTFWNWRYDKRKMEKAVITFARIALAFTDKTA